jgi:superfamily I DNA and/or RNA helicase
VIFDEASQITLEEAIPSLFRARQAIVVGDEMQLPPTDFFAARRDGGEDDEEEDFAFQASGFGLQASAEGWRLEPEARSLKPDLDGNSFLNHAARHLPSTMLGWHYRSRSESLISFSNCAFYDGRLLTVPERQAAAQARPPLRAKKPGDAATAAAAVLERPISFHLLERAVYEKRRNRAEADYIAQLVRSILTLARSASEGGARTDAASGSLARRASVDAPSIGIVAFSEAQQDEIEAALQRLGQQDSAFRTLLDAEWEREENGQFVGLLVKNLENIQGDERDVVILSVCYGHGPSGKMLMNFGPINKAGGQKRLNVAFSRAKQHMVVVSSITHADITNDYNDGAACLKNYLRYAEAVSCGDQQSAALVLRSIAPPQAGRRGDAPTDDAALEQIAAALSQAGYEVDRRIGQSHFRCDLAVRKPGDMAYRLGILLDGDDYYAQSDLLERDLLRPRLLRAFGWRTAHVLAKDWYEDPQAVISNLSDLLESKALRAKKRAAGRT